VNIRSIIRITERGRTASLTGSWQREARWQIIKAHDGRTVRAYKMNSGKLGLEALRRRMRDGWVELDESDKRRTAEGIFGKHDIHALMTRQKGICFYCDRSIRRRYHIDHFIPVSRGGTHWPTNLRLACQPCNRVKRDLMPWEFTPKVRRYRITKAMIEAQVTITRPGA
jgi:hypothetical protein